MERSELIRRLTLNSICDDYENLDQIILSEVAGGAARFGFAVERSEVGDALSGLVKDGFAKAYRLSSLQPCELEGMPSLDVVDEYFPYFLITKKGLDLHLSDDTWWPFDD